MSARPICKPCWMLTRWRVPRLLWASPRRKRLESKMKAAWLALLLGASSALAQPSPSGTIISDSQPIVDAQLNLWTLSRGIVYENGKPAGFSAGVTLLLYYSGVVFQENASCGWWSWNGAMWATAAKPTLAAIPSRGLHVLPPPTPPVTPPAPSRVFGIGVSGH